MAGKPATLRALSATLAIGAALSATSAYPQAANGQECTGLGSAAAEIACLREALGAARGTRAGTESQPPPAVPPPRSRAERPVAAAQGASASLGQEQLARVAAPTPTEQAEPGRIIATLTASRADLHGLLVMQLDNGQIWRQDEAVDLPIRLDENKTLRVEIARSGFGGYRMSFPDLGRRIAVSRLR